MRSGTIGRLTAWALGALLLVGCPKPPAGDSGSVSEALAAIVATCAEARGTVEVRRTGQPAWEPVALGAVFHAGDWVRSGPHSSARIEFLAGGRVELPADAAVVIDPAWPRDAGP